MVYRPLPLLDMEATGSFRCPAWSPGCGGSSENLEKRAGPEKPHRCQTNGLIAAERADGGKEGGKSTGRGWQLQPRSSAMTSPSQLHLLSRGVHTHQLQDTQRG